MRTSLSYAVIALATGCGSDPGRSTPAPLVTLTAQATVLAPPPPPSRERILAHAACERLSPCKLVALRSVGAAGDREQVLAIISRGIRSEPGVEAPTELPEVHAFDGEADVFSASYGGCTGHDVWVIDFDGERAQRTRLLTHICNDGHGAAGVGEDRLTVKDGRVVLEQSGGSNWRWSRTSLLALDQGVLETKRESWFTMGPEASEGTWDNVAFRGAASWSVARCAPNHQPPDPDAEVVTFLFHPIPRVQIDPTFARGAWTSTRLEPCTTAFDGKTWGFAIGSSKAEPSSVLRVVASGNDLFVEVEDDEAVAGPRGDRLELWSSETFPGSQASCASTKVAASGVSIDVDSAVASPVGPRTAAPLPLVFRATPPVSGTRGAHALRFMVSYRKLPEGMTVVYRDVDRSKATRDIATSNFDPRDVATLGTYEPLVDLRCAAEGGALRVSSPNLARRGEPLAEAPFARPAP